MGKEMENLINEFEAADMLGLKVATLRRWRWAATGVPWVKVGGTTVRYSPEAVRAFIRAGTVDPEDVRQCPSK